MPLRFWVKLLIRYRAGLTDGVGTYIDGSKIIVQAKELQAQNLECGVGPR